LANQTRNDLPLAAIKHPYENCAGQITTDEGGGMASQVFDDSDESVMSLQKFQRRVTMATCTIPYGYLSARPEDYFDRMSGSDQDRARREPVRRRGA